MAIDYGAQNNVWGRVRVQVRRYFAAIRRFWWLLPLTASVGMCLAAWIVAQMPAAYESDGEMVQAGQYQLSTNGAVYNDERENYLGTQMQLMQSVRLRQEALATVQTLHPDLKPDPDVDLTVKQSPQAAMLILTVTAKSPEFAQAYLDACMHTYLDDYKQMRDDAAQGTNAGLSKEMARVSGSIDTLDAQMLAFQKQNDVGLIEGEGNTAAKYLDELNRHLSELQANYNLLSMLDLDQSLDREQTQAQTDSSAPASGGTTDTRLDTLTNFGPIADYQKARQDLALLKAQLADMSRRLKPKHPDIIALNQLIQQKQDLIDTLKVQSEDAFKTHREDLKVQIQNLQNQIQDQQQKAVALNATLAQYNDMKTKEDRLKTEYGQLLTSSQGVVTGNSVDQNPLTIYQPASPAGSVKPGLVKILLAGLGGGILVGLLILFIVDQTDDRISSLMELQTHFPEELLGQIPAEKLEGDAALLRSDDDRQALLEAFRTLRSSIIFLPVEGKRPKTIVVTSALPDEGKTTVASNLAVTLAFSGARTLIIDADLRRGQTSHVFGAKDCNGLSSVLLQKKTWRESVYTTSTENLFIMPCGPALHHTSEHLLGKVTDQFLVSIYDQFDYVILDSPPVLVIDDTLCLAPKVDGTLFVLRFDSSSVRSSRRALDLLDHRQANILGVVCNGVTLSETEYTYNYNYRQYGNRYAEVKPHDNGHAKKTRDALAG